MQVSHLLAVGGGELRIGWVAGQAWMARAAEQQIEKVLAFLLAKAEQLIHAMNVLLVLIWGSWGTVDEGKSFAAFNQ